MDLRTENKVKIEGGMSSMTDLVFLLLIFFIILSTMVTTGHSIDLPKGTGTTKDKSITRVYVDNQNNVFIQNSKKNIDKQVTMDELKSTIMNYVDEKKTIELVGDKQSDWEYSVGVIDIAKNNGLKIVIKTKTN